MSNRKQKTPFPKNFFEKTAWNSQSLVCGIDEVGRGCLAGPVVAAAVILPFKKASYRLLKDSKELSEAERLKAYKWITQHCNYGIGIVNNRLIDLHNIYQANILAMKKALVAVLATSPGLPVSAILIDAVPLNIFDTGYNLIPVHAFPKGEKKSSSIAAASIIAKVTRDKLMERFDHIFPGYNLGQHKGYAAQTHKKAIIDQGHTLIHRTSFLSSTFAEKEKLDANNQQTFC